MRASFFLTHGGPKEIRLSKNIFLLYFVAIFIVPLRAPGVSVLHAGTRSDPERSASDGKSFRYQHKIHLPASWQPTVRSTSRWYPSQLANPAAHPKRAAEKGYIQLLGEEFLVAQELSI